MTVSLTVLSGCSFGGGASARSAGDGGAESRDESAVVRLDAAVGGLEAAVDEVTAPLDEAEKVFDELERLIASVGEGARAELIRIIVSFVNTGNAEFSANSETRAVGGSVDATIAANGETESSGQSGGVLLDEKVTEPEDSGVVLAEEAEGDAAPSEAPNPASVSRETFEQAKAVGLHLRAVLAALAATPARVKALAVVAKDTLVAVPKLGAEAIASAQVRANNPLGGAAVRAEAQAELAKIQGMVGRVQSKVAEIQKQALSLPPRAANFAARAQQILMGAVLNPPSVDAQVEGGALARLEASTTQIAAFEEEPAKCAPEARRPFQWGWFAVSGATGVAAVVGGAVYLNANSQLSVCNDPFGFGCSNYEQLLNQRNLGTVLFSAGAATMTTTLIGGIVANSGRRPGPEVGSGFACGAGFQTVSCEGTF